MLRNCVWWTQFFPTSIGIRRCRLGSVKSELGSRAMHRAVEQNGGAYALREPGEAYNGGGESEPLRLENTISWNAEAAEI
jgi:hypothetical protein